MKYWDYEVIQERTLTVRVYEDELEDDDPSSEVASIAAQDSAQDEWEETVWEVNLISEGIE
jgi:hypothetical protein